MCITLEVLHTEMPKYWTKIISKMAAAAILDFCTNSNNSAGDWRRWMKFCINVDGCYRKWHIWPKWTKIINSRWRRPPFWIPFIAHNSFITAHNCTKFDTCIAFEVLHTSMPEYWTKIKSKMTAAAILDFCTIAILSRHLTYTVFLKKLDP